MNKKISIFAAAALATTLVASASSPFQGVYGGAKIGGAFNTNSVDQTGSASVIDQDGDLLNVTWKNSLDLGSSGITGGVFIGYRQIFDNLAAGIEVAYNLEDTSASAKSTTMTQAISKVKVKAGNSWDFLATVGTTITPKTLAYAKAGIRLQDFDFSENGQIAAQDFKSSKSKTGLLMGVGLDVQAKDQMLVRLEGTRQFGIKLAAKGDGYTTEFDNKSAGFTVGIVYKLS